MPSLLPAVVPAIPENRAEVAGARLARKVAPLFGVPWPEGPFGDRTWVCDFAKITLSEIARGAPLPTRAEAARLGPPGAEGWRLVERIGVAAKHATLPNEIANATLNRFGPDTRAAVVLTAVNRLLAPVEDAIEAALPLLVDATGAPLAPRLRLAAWAGLVVEAFRSQPALVAAGIHARAIQNELVESWTLPVAVGLDGLRLTRCEVGSADAPVASSTSTRPCTLDVADRTLPAIAPDTALDHDAERGEGTPMALTSKLRATETVDMLLRQLLAAGTPADASYLWLSEREPGQLAVEALLPSTGLIDRFVRHRLPATDRTGTGHSGTAGYTLPAAPAPDRLAAQPVLVRRAVIIALVTVLRHVQSSAAGREATRHDIVSVLADVAALARHTLDPDDPVAALTACRIADMMVQTLRPDLRHDLHDPLHDLLAGLDRCEDLLRRGLLDRGAAAEAISSACVELNAVRRTNARQPDSGLPGPDELDERLRRSWRAFHEALEIPVAITPEVPGLAGYHLQNYAAYLAGSAQESDVRAAAELFGTVVIPARTEFFVRSGHFLPVRHALQGASRASTRLGESARERGEHAEARHWAQLGFDWVQQALAADETQQLITAQVPTENACRFALLAAPALLLVAELDGAAHRVDDVAQAAELIDLAVRWEASAVGDGRHHTRHEEVTALVRRLEAMRG